MSANQHTLYAFDLWTQIDTQLEQKKTKEIIQPDKKRIACSSLPLVRSLAGMLRCIDAVDVCSNLFVQLT